MTLTENEIKIFVHNQDILRKLYEEKQKMKIVNRNEKQKLYEREKRRLRKSALSNF